MMLGNRRKPIRGLQVLDPDEKCSGVGEKEYISIDVSTRSVIPSVCNLPGSLSLE